MVMSLNYLGCNNNIIGVFIAEGRNELQNGEMSYKNNQGKLRLLDHSSRENFTGSLFDTLAFCISGLYVMTAVQ